MSALSDLRADLDAIVDELDDFGNTLLSPTADRLRHLLDDRGILDAPTTSEIIAHLDAGGRVRWWSAFAGQWKYSSVSAGWWHDRLAEYGDQPQPDYRLAPLPPATKRVRLDQLPGHKLPGQTDEVFEVHNLSRDGWAWAALDERAYPLDVADDGTVEVQA